MTRKELSDAALEGILQRVAAKPQQAAGTDFENRIRALPRQHAQSQPLGAWLRRQLQLFWPQKAGFAMSLATAGVLGFMVGSTSLVSFNGQIDGDWNDVDAAGLIFQANPYDDVVGEDL